MLKALKGKTIKDCSWPASIAPTRTGVIKKVFQTAGRVEVEWSTGKTTEVAISKIHDKPERTTGYFVMPKPAPETDGKEGFMPDAVAAHESHGGAAIKPTEPFTENAPAELDANNVPADTLSERFVADYGKDPSDA